LLLLLLQLDAKQQLQQPHTPNAKDDKEDNDDGTHRTYPSSLNPKTKTAQSPTNRQTKSIEEFCPVNSPAPE